MCSSILTAIVFLPFILIYRLHWQAKKITEWGYDTIVAWVSHAFPFIKRVPSQLVFKQYDDTILETSDTILLPLYVMIFQPFG